MTLTEPQVVQICTAAGQAILSGLLAFGGVLLALRHASHQQIAASNSAAELSRTEAYRAELARRREVLSDWDDFAAGWWNDAQHWDVIAGGGRDQEALSRFLNRMLNAANDRWFRRLPAKGTTEWRLAEPIVGRIQRWVGPPVKPYADFAEAIAALSPAMNDITARRRDLKTEIERLTALMLSKTVPETLEP